MAEYKYDVNTQMTTNEIIEAMKEQLKLRGPDLQNYLREIDAMDQNEKDDIQNNNSNINILLQKQQPHILEILEHSKEADLQTMKSYRDDAIRLQAEANLNASKYAECLTYINYIISSLTWTFQKYKQNYLRIYTCTVYSSVKRYKYKL